jgi:hypothetical protein
MENPAGNNSLGMLVTSSNFHSFPSFSVSAVDPLFKHFCGYPWKSMEGLLRLRGSNPLGSKLRLLARGPERLRLAGQTSALD